MKEFSKHQPQKFDLIFMLFSYKIEENKKIFCHCFFPGLRVYKNVKFHFCRDTIPLRWETEDSIAVMSIQGRYFRPLFIPQLFRKHSTFPVIILSTQFSSCAYEKQPRNKEIAKLAILY